MRWTDTRQPGDGDGVEESVRLPEVVVGGEGVVRAPADMVATLLHEAGHMLER